MFPHAVLRDLYLHMEWADASVWKVVLAANSIRDNSNVHDKLCHLHRTQQFFLKVWRGEPVSYEKHEIPFNEELVLARKFHGEAQDYLSEIDQAGLASDLVIPWADHFAKSFGREHAGPTTRGESMYQVVAHSTYHRGQLNTMIRELGSDPPLADYIAWLWTDRPPAEWPAASST